MERVGDGMEREIGEGRESDAKERMERGWREERQESRRGWEKYFTVMYNSLQNILINLKNA